MVILNITCFFSKVLSHLVCAKSCAWGCELFHPDSRDFPLCFPCCTWTHGMLPWLFVPLCVCHSLCSLSETSGPFLFPFFLPQAKHTEGGLWPQGMLLLRWFQREQMAMAHEHFRHHYHRGWAHLKETEKPICPAIQTMSLPLADTTQPRQCTQPGC